MHEVSLVHALFDEADRAVGSHPPAAVRLVEVRVGARAGVEPDLFITAFECVRRERGYDAAALRLVPTGGRELVLARLELEVPDV